MSSNFSLSCVLFDLDGTLVDSAPDLIAALNQALHDQDLNSISSTELKPYISYGAAAMINQCLDSNHDARTRSNILENMLSHYQANIAEHTRMFNGISTILNNIEASGLKWGVVTNKRKRFTEPLMQALGLTHRAACIVSGDSTAYSKPHPQPMLNACQIANVKADECLFIGDSALDIEAGNNVNMKTLAAVYGYLKPDDQPQLWGADALVNSPAEISSWIAT